jgi:hypothetical protein
MYERSRHDRHQQAGEPLSWTKFEWRTGADNYSFALSSNGMFGTLTAPAGREITLPVVAWEGLFDAVKVNTKSKSVAERNLPARSGSRWTEEETDELERRFKAGASVSELARSHARTVWAVEGQLAKSGLWDRIERRPLLDGLQHYEPPLNSTLPISMQKPRPENVSGHGDEWRKEIEQET